MGSQSSGSDSRDGRHFGCDIYGMLVHSRNGWAEDHRATRRARGKKEGAGGRVPNS